MLRVVRPSRNGRAAPVPNSPRPRAPARGRSSSMLRVVRPSRNGPAAPGTPATTEPVSVERCLTTTAAPPRHSRTRRAILVAVPDGPAPQPSPCQPLSVAQPRSRQSAVFRSALPFSDHLALATFPRHFAGSPDPANPAPAAFRDLLHAASWRHRSSPRPSAPSTLRLLDPAGPAPPRHPAPATRHPTPAARNPAPATRNLEPATPTPNTQHRIQIEHEHEHEHDQGRGAPVPRS